MGLLPETRATPGPAVVTTTQAQMRGQPSRQPTELGERHVCGIGLIEFDDGGWAYSVGGVEYELTADDREWIVSSVTSTGERTGLQRVGDRALAERAFFWRVTDTILACGPYRREAWINGAFLALVDLDGCWHLAERSGAPLAAGFSDEQRAREAWETRAHELIHQAAVAMIEP